MVEGKVPLLDEEGTTAIDISPKGSMEGYSLKVWLIKNKNDVKYLLMAVSGVATFFSMQGSTPEWAVVLLTTIVPALVKIGVDAIDYYHSEVKL